MTNALKPLYPYAGGKQKSLKYIAEYLKPTGTYVEPFFGGGAVYCHMYNRRLAKRYVINDRRADIIGIYRAIQDDAVAFSDEAEDLIRRYGTLSPGQQEAMFVRYRDAIVVEYNAAQCLFVRKANYGGMSKTHPDGTFEESSGHWRPANKKVSFDRQQVYLWKQALDRAEILCGDFQHIPIGKEPAIVFCDPPYYASTVEYGSFSKADQLRCLEWCSALAENKDITVMFSNRDQDRFFSKRVGSDVNVIYFDILYTSGTNNVSSKEALFIWNERGDGRSRKSR